MELKVEIEMTGSFTSSFITNNQGRKEEISVKTAPDSLTSLKECIEKGAHELGYDSARDLLKWTNSVTLRVPEMIADMLANGTGAQIGLIVSRGHETDVYGAGNEHHPILGASLAQNLVAGVEEETNAGGEQVILPHEADVQEKMSYLLNLGCSIITASLKRASLNPANEVRLKEIAHADYPRHYLGAVPILIASDFSDDQDDARRTNVCLLNAYTWFALDQFLRRVENSLQENGYARSLKVMQTDGEAVPITRVTPLKTCGPEQIANVNQFIGASGVV